MASDKGGAPFGWSDGPPDKLLEQLKCKEDAVPEFDLTPESPEASAGGIVPDSAQEAAGQPRAAGPTADRVVNGRVGAGAANVQPVQFMPFSSRSVETGRRNIDLLMDVPLPVVVELGRTTMLVRDILSIGPGSVIELEKAAGENVDILVNGRLIARGEVVVIEENFGVRIVEFVSNPENAVPN
jgi:flagellar motor switch protein FliN/FliY